MLQIRKQQNSGWFAAVKSFQGLGEVNFSLNIKML